MLDQLTALRGSPPPAGELAAHQAALVGAFERAAETGAETADLLADYATHHVRLSEFDRYPERIEAVTRGQALAAATRLVDPANVDVLIVGDARQLRQLREDGVIEFHNGALVVTNPRKLQELTEPGLDRPHRSPDAVDDSRFRSTLDVAPSDAATPARRTF